MTTAVVARLLLIDPRTGAKTADFDFASIAETISFLRGHEHAAPRRRRAKSVTPKTGAKPNA
jgi:hypothetical protein